METTIRISKILKNNNFQSEAFWWLFLSIFQYVILKFFAKIELFEILGRIPK